ncbi:hypothetical protein PVK06_023228 [Gossypium arboreum]|uniref:RNase H type-1 domain-containing protein n=1 Tax=Gossypium arboreum TaxID=29729 RepID=A0ABR0PAX3_GOSAR|nr:hypothetical protein PVK06_023228 [Gossypium arboreum]
MMLEGHRLPILAYDGLLQGKEVSKLIVMRHGIAAIVRNEKGEIVEGVNAFLIASSVQVVEALAVHLGATLVARRKWTDVLIESDNSDLISSLKGGNNSC